VLSRLSRLIAYFLTPQYKKGVPVEVAPFAYAKLLHNLHVLGSPNASLRMAVAKAGPVVSDNGNFVIDAPFNEEMMSNPYAVCPISPTLRKRASAHTVFKVAVNHQDAYGRR
jgi:hypothetical protein